MDRKSYKKSYKKPLTGYERDELEKLWTEIQVILKRADANQLDLHVSLGARSMCSTTVHYDVVMIRQMLDKVLEFHEGAIRDHVGKNDEVALELGVTTLRLIRAIEVLEECFPVKDWTDLVCEHYHASESESKKTSTTINLNDSPVRGQG